LEFQGGFKLLDWCGLSQNTEVLKTVKTGSVWRQPASSMVMAGSIWPSLTSGSRRFHEAPWNDGKGVVYGLAFADLMETAGRTLLRAFRRAERDLVQH
jgi:hypothetical protein